MNVRKPIILFSGGLDSTALLMLAKEQHIEPTLLHIEYNHPAVDQELEAVQIIAEQFDLTKNLHVHKTEINAETMFIGSGQKGSRYVRGRNLLFLAIAYNLTFKFRSNEIWLGCTKNDFDHYADCRPDFILEVNQLLSEVSVIAPFIYQTRAQILQNYNVLNYPTWSCYEPLDVDVPCKACNSCTQV